MKSVLFIDKDEKIFLPSLLYVDEFEKLLRKKKQSFNSSCFIPLYKRCIS